MLRACRVARLSWSLCSSFWVNADFENFTVLYNFPAAPLTALGAGTSYGTADLQSTWLAIQCVKELINLINLIN
jgi:hypothetical protein